MTTAQNFNPKEYLTIRQFAEKAKLTTQAIRKQIDSGKIPRSSVVVCGLTWIKKTELKKRGKL